MRNERLVSLRASRTQSEVAKAIGMPKSTYAMIEGGKRFPRKDRLIQMASFFDVSVDDLFFANHGHR